MPSQVDNRPHLRLLRRTHCAALDASHLDDVDIASTFLTADQALQGARQNDQWRRVGHGDVLAT